MSEVTRLYPISEMFFTFIVFLLCMYLPRGAMGWSVICDGGLSWSIFFLRRLSYLGSVGFLFRYECQYWDEIGFLAYF